MLFAPTTAMGWARKALCLLISGLGMLAEGYSQSGRSVQVQWQPAKLVNGSPGLLQLSTSTGVQSLSGICFGHNLTFFRAVHGRRSCASAGVPWVTTPGRDAQTIQHVPACR